MSDNKKYVSNSEVQRAFNSDSNIKYLKEKLIALSVLIMILLVGFLYFSSENKVDDKIEKTGESSNDYSPAKSGFNKPTNEKKGQEKDVDTESDTDTDTEFDTNTESTQDKESPVETITDNKNKPGLKKEIIETVINIDLKEIDQNRYSWNSEIAAKGLKSTIKIINGRKNELKYDVTGKSSFNFNSGDTRFDGVKSKVSLEIEKTDNVKLKGENEIKVTTSCSNKSTK
jgi:hypothetical protein